MLDEELIAAEEALDGYYCIITSETEMDDFEIIEAYRGLWLIEDSFKVTKSCLSARPVYVSNELHIEAHFLICYIALVIMRLMQLNTGFTISAQAIATELSKINAVHFEDNYWRLYRRNDIAETLCNSVGIDLRLKTLRLEQIKDILAKVNKK